MSNETTTIDAAAEKLLRVASGYIPGPYSWLNRPPRLADLWPVDQERYRRMARELLP